MTAQPLYTIAAELTDLVDRIIESGGELSPDVEAQLASLEADFERKLEHCAVVVRNLEAERDKHTAEARRQQDRAGALEKTAQALKGYMKREMEVAGIGKVEGVARIQKNSRPAIAWTREPETIPNEYRRVIFSLDGEKAYATVRAGEALPEGFAVEYGTHLRVLV